jgi:hypothetical protein
MPTLQAIRDAYLSGSQREFDASRAGSEWYLEESELPTEQAEEAATEAYLAAQRGDLRRALDLAHSACELERQEYGECRTWLPFRQAVEEAWRDTETNPA